jgi:hypothetical protein
MMVGRRLGWSPAFQTLAVPRSRDGRYRERPAPGGSAGHRGRARAHRLLILIAISAFGPGAVARAQIVNPPPPPGSLYTDGASVAGAVPAQVFNQSVTGGGTSASLAGGFTIDSGPTFETFGGSGAGSVFGNTGRTFSSSGIQYEAGLVYASASLSASGNLPLPQDGAAGSAQLEFFALIKQTQPFPLSLFGPPTFVPITISGLLRADASGSGSSIASVDVTEGPFVSLGGEYVARSNDVNIRLDISNNFRTMSFSVNRDFTFGDLLRTTIFADSAGTGSPFSGGSDFDGDATADPTFSFDQSAFDAYAAQQGFPTFPLDQYLEFEFSPDLYGLGVPEPSSALLMLAASVPLGAFVAARRLRASASRRRDQGVPLSGQ